MNYGAMTGAAIATYQAKNASLAAENHTLRKQVGELVELLHAEHVKCSFGVPLTPKNNPCGCNRHAAYFAAITRIEEASDGK